ncbi:G-protein coupled receptor Mth-like isoform X2 [Anoplolepis gracilipes]|uniref:G-protein coupled receptor Mth-like isoform X2 n=1 Tax=Anoplolepis gracilipes TaxID=354296 RepID=UPI003BA1AA0E
MWYKSFELWCCAFLFLVSSSKSRNFTIKNKQDNNSIVRYERHANFSPKNGQTDFNRYNLRKNFLHENAQDVFHSNSKSIHHKDDYSMQNKFPVHYVKYYEKGNRITSELQMNFKKFNKDNIDTENDNKNDVVSYMTCENNICINLCCPPGNRLVSDSCIAEEAEYALPNVHGLIDLEHNESKVDEMFQLIVQNPCKNNGNEIIKLPLYDHMFYFQYIFLENGTLYLPYFHEFVDVKNYCLAVVDGNQEFDAFICSETSKTMKTFVKKLHENFKMELITYKLKIVHFSYCMISVLCMLTIFLIYSVPELNNMHGFMLCRYTSASFMFYLVEIIFPYYKILAYSTCVTKVSMSYYFLMAGNFWLCVMSFDMWWTFRDFRSLQKNASQQGKKKLIYSILGWGGPFILIIINIIMEFVPNLPKNMIRPEFIITKNMCWYNTRAADLLYNYGPHSICIFSSLCLSIYTTFKMKRLEKDTTCRFRDSESRCFNENKRWSVEKMDQRKGVTGTVPMSKVLSTNNSVERAEG